MSAGFGVLAGCIDCYTGKKTCHLRNQKKKKKKNWIKVNYFETSEKLSNCVELRDPECYEIIELPNCSRLKGETVVEQTDKTSTYFYNWLINYCLSDAQHPGKTVFEQEVKS